MNTFKNLKNEPDLTSTLKVFEDAIKYNKINCCRVGIVDEYDANTRVAKVLIANKLELRQNNDGSVVTQDYAPIYAKVLFFGWKDIGITHPVLKGSEGILLFNDREIESWFINGNINNIAHQRAHSKTDAIFISGLLSLPNMVTTLQNSLHLFYNSTDVQLSDTGVQITGDTNITGNNTITGSNTITGITTSGGLVDTTAPSGTFTTADGKIITFENGIIKNVS